MLCWVINVPCGVMDCPSFTTGGHILIINQATLKPVNTNGPSELPLPVYEPNELKPSTARSSRQPCRQYCCRKCRNPILLLLNHRPPIGAAECPTSIKSQILIVVLENSALQMRQATALVLDLVITSFGTAFRP